MTGQKPRTLLIGATLAWVALIIVALALTGCPRFGAFYAAFLATSLAVAAAELLFLNALRRNPGERLFRAFKKLTGYAIVALYVAHALPRVEWTNNALVAGGRAAFLFALSLVVTAAGIALFIVMTRPAVQLAFGAITAEEARDRAVLKKNRKERKPGPLGTLLEWVDALAQAVIIVILIEVFIFQLYVVPSESMVPVFLSGDRPFTVKLTAGPRLPLTEWRLPFIKQPSRGDVVTIANPRYPENSTVNLKKYFSQFVYMVTFTAVNLDRTAADGTPKADPLVKRIVGVPGEKLMMVDDVLYARRAGQGEYQPVEQDVKRYARTDLWKLPEGVRRRVAVIPVDEKVRAVLAEWDARKNGSTPAQFSARLADSWRALELRRRAVSPAALASFERRELPNANPRLRELRDEALKAAPAGADNPIAAMGAGVEDFSLAMAVAASPTALAALEEYALAGRDAICGPTAYERGSRSLNLLIKLNLIARVERDLALLAAGAPLSGIEEDAQRRLLMSEAAELFRYLNAYYDARNFPEFPQGDAFLGPDQYFAMGDNRYNSLDFRYAADSTLRVLDPSDPTSVRYQSSLSPFPLEKRFIEGYAIFRLWPLSRMGVIR